jgi:hypothetical protein
MGSCTDSLILTFDHVWSRLTSRIVGMNDDEYFWEPVPGCWSLRQDDNGTWRLDGGGGGGPAPNPVPVTTIVWRLGHLGGVALGGFTNWRFGDATLKVEDIDFPSTVEEAPRFLEVQYRGWRDALGALGDAEWEAPLGPSWGAYADDSTFDLALHVLDEVIHHGAEVGVLRDLYSEKASLG